ncbi:MAG: HPr family phosphocarrier protein [Lachnospiraceae bacterium]|nr:HPr family phosphocarrier protein [Lachnospiraceae bacterium]
MLTKNITVDLPANQEARPVAMIVQVASRYDSRVHMESGNIRANVKSIMGMMAFGLKNGMEVVVTAEGSDEAAAVEAVARQLTSAAV